MILKAIPKQISDNVIHIEKKNSLDGRKLDGKPTAKGIYINNGRKVVMK